MLTCEGAWKGLHECYPFYKKLERGEREYNLKALSLDLESEIAIQLNECSI